MKILLGTCARLINELPTGPVYYLLQVRCLVCVCACVCKKNYLCTAIEKQKHGVGGVKIWLGKQQSVECIPCSTIMIVDQYGVC